MGIILHSLQLFPFHIVQAQKNAKADALSRLHAPEEKSKEPEPVLPRRIIMYPIRFNLDQQLPSSNASLPGVLRVTSVPRTQRTNLIHSVHPSVGTQGPTAPSHCYKNASGGPAWQGTGEGSFRDVRMCHLEEPTQTPPVPQCSWSQCLVNLFE